MDELSRTAGVSKALVYAYFPDQHALANAMLARRFDALAAQGISEAAAQADVATAALACADLYFAQVAEAGPVVHIVLRDPFMAGRVDADIVRVRDRLSRRLARAARRSLRLSAKEAVAALSLMTTIPEEAGRLTFAGDLTPERGRELTARLAEAEEELAFRTSSWRKMSSAVSARRRVWAAPAAGDDGARGSAEQTRDDEGVDRLPVATRERLRRRTRARICICSQRAARICKEYIGTERAQCAHDSSRQRLRDRRCAARHSI